MKNAIKSFWAFTPLSYKLLMLFIAPMLVVLFNVVLLLGVGELGGVLGLLISFVSLCMLDVFSDEWVLKGFYMKSNSSLEFLQTSNKFERLIKDIVIVDMTRRILMYLFLYGAIAVIGVSVQGKEMWSAYYSIYAYFPLLMFVVSQAMLWAVRHFNSLQSMWISASMSTVVLWLAITVLTFFGAKMNYGPVYLVVVYGGLALLAIAISVVIVGYSIKKVRDSYYDK